MTLRAYRIYVASVLLFVAQLEDLPSTFDHAEATACRRLFPGPHLWITPGVLKELRALEFPTDLACIHTIAVAAKSRVVRYENVAQGGLQAGTTEGGLHTSSNGGMQRPGTATVGMFMDSAASSFYS